MKLYFVRHGESVANIERVFSNRDLDHPLTPRGVDQSNTLARSLAGRPIRRIFTSPVKRAVQTAAIVAAVFGVEYQVSAALREWDVGIYEGTGDPLGWQMHSQVMDDWLIRQQYDSKMPGGESFNEIRARFVPFVEGLLREGGHTDEEVLLVGHGGLYGCMLPQVFGNVDADFLSRYGFSNTGYALGESRASGLVCLEWCGVALAV